ncbi:MAG: prolipoprotein diacylglyceryl transferase [Proteobacteria bacterium]|nr:prolipoprotein diacylglyceryl transferase [Pseudomonadota bacterium]
MYPDLLEIFGVTLHGVLFERILWGILSALMIWGCVSSILIIRKGRKAEGIIQGLIVLAILIWSGRQFIATFNPAYMLMFEKPLVVHSYAFCILVGVVLGILTAMKMAERRDLNGIDIAKLCIWLTVLGFLGARAAHVIVDWQHYYNACFAPEIEGLQSADCLRVLNFGEGGLTFYGGVIAGMFVVAVYFIRRHRRGVPAAVFAHLDALAGALAITHAFGRLGCLAAGCCWGAITTGTIGVRYGADSFAFAELVQNPEYHDAMMLSGKTPLLHATQVYESVGELLIYGVLWLMIAKKVRPGMMVGVWFVAYGVLRFVVEIMRDDSERGYYFERTYDGINALFNVVPGHSTILSTSQGIGLVMIAIGTVLMVLSRTCSRPSAS